MKRLSLALAVCLLISIISPLNSVSEASEYDGGDIVISDGQSLNVEGDVDGSISVSGNESIVTVIGNVQDSSWASINASESGTAIISGNVDNSNYFAINAATNASVSVGGDVNGGVEASKGGSVSIAGNVHLYSEHSTVVHADEGGHIQIDGGVTTDEEHPYGGSVLSYHDSSVSIGDKTIANVTVYDNSSAEINNDLTTAGILVFDGSALTVNGNIESENRTFEIHMPEGETLILNVAKPIEVLDSSLDVNGNVNITTDLNSRGASGRFREEGDSIISDSNVIPSSVHAENSEVTIHGDLEATGMTPSALMASESSTVLVEGNVTANGNIPTGVIAVGESEVQITGDVINNNENGTGIEVSDKSEVIIGGNINTENGTAIIANGESSVAVGGDVKSDGAALNLQQSTVTVDGKVIGYIYADDSTVTIAGDVNSKIDAHNDTLITIGGNYEGDLYSGGAEVKINGEAKGNIDACGPGTVVTVVKDADHVESFGGATVNVGENVNSGISVSADSKAYVDGNVNGTSVIEENGTLVVGGDVSFSYPYGFRNKGAVEIAGDIIAWDPGKSAVEVAGENAVLTVGGDSNVSVRASDGATVDIQGDANGLQASTGSTVVAHGNSDAGALASGKDAYIEVGGDVSGTAVATTGGEVVIQGDLTGNSMGAIHAYVGEGGTVQVTGNVSSDSTFMPSIYAMDGSNVTVDGDLSGENADALYASGDGTDISIKGDIEAGKNGIVAEDGATVTVGTGAESDTGDTGTKSTITAGDTAISATNGSDIDVQGNATAGNIGIQVTIGSSDDEKSNIIVNGVVDGTNKAVELNVGEGVDTEAVIAALPQIIVQSLETEGELVAVTAPSEEVDKNAVTDALISQLCYIVNEEDIDEANISVFGTEIVDDYVVAKETSKITLKSTREGYVVCGVSAGKYATVEENEDGSYTITVERGGDLTLVASVKEKESDQPTEPDSPENPSNPEKPDEPSNPENPSVPSKPDTPYNPYNPIIPSVPSFPGSGEYWNDPWIANTVDSTVAPVTNNGQTVSANNYYQNRNWDPAYVLSPDYSAMVLVINLIGRQELCVLRSDLEAFRDIGFGTVNIVTENDSMYMTMADLIGLYSGANQCMFARNGNTVELWVMNSIVFTITLVKDKKTA